MKVLVSYEQLFNGQLLKDSYTRTVSSEVDIKKIYSSLWSDPHITDVHVVIISERSNEE